MRRQHSSDKTVKALSFQLSGPGNEYKPLCVGNYIRIQSQVLGASDPRPPAPCMTWGPFHSTFSPAAPPPALPCQLDLSGGERGWQLNSDLSEREETAEKQIFLPFPPEGKDVCPDKTLWMDLQPLL